jgi:hypothetical protein
MIYSVYHASLFGIVTSRSMVIVKTTAQATNSESDAIVVLMAVLWVAALAAA